MSQEHLTEEIFVEYLLQLVKDGGGEKRFSIEHDVTQELLHNILTNAISPPEFIARKFGYTKQTTYVKIGEK